MQAGVRQSASDYILFTDADIAHPSHSLRRLVARSMADNLDLNLVDGKAERQNVFRKAIDPRFRVLLRCFIPSGLPTSLRRVAAAAGGGVMLVNKKALANIGGLARIKGFDRRLLARSRHQGQRGNYARPGAFA